jgi:hypothetical protein
MGHAADRDFSRFLFQDRRVPTRCFVGRLVADSPRNINRWQAASPPLIYDGTYLWNRFSDMDSDACLPIGRNRGMDTPKDRFTGVPVAGIAGVRGVGLDGPWPSISTCDLSSLRLLYAGSSSYTLTLNPPSISFAQESPRFLVSFFLI